MIPQLLRQRDPIEEEMLQRLRLRFRTGAHGTLPPGALGEEQVAPEAPQGWSINLPQPTPRGPLTSDTGYPYQFVRKAPITGPIQAPPPPPTDPGARSTWQMLRDSIIGTPEEPGRTGSGTYGLRDISRLRGSLGFGTDISGRSQRLPPIGPPAITTPPPEAPQMPSLMQQSAPMAYQGPGLNAESGASTRVAGDLRRDFQAQSGVNGTSLFSDDTRTSMLPEVSEGSGSSPAQEALTENEKREKRINNLNTLRAIAEGAGRIGDTFVEYGDRMAGQPIQKARDYTTGIDEALAREEDKIPKSLLEKLREAGYDMPEGTTFPQLKQVMPAFANAMDSRIAMARAGQAQANANRSHDLARQRQETLESGERRRMDTAYRPEYSETKELIGAKTAIDLLDRISAMDPNSDQVSTGPMQTFWKEFVSKHAPGVDMSDWNRFKSALEGSSMNVLRDIIGSQMTGNEQRRAEGYIPSIWSQEQFREEAINNLRTMFQTKIDNTLRALKASKKDTSGLESELGTTSEMVRVRLPDGREDEIHSSRVEDMKSKYPGLEVLGQ